MGIFEWDFGDGLARVSNHKKINKKLARNTLFGYAGDARPMDGHYTSRGPVCLLVGSLKSPGSGHGYLGPGSGYLGQDTHGQDTHCRF